MMNTATMPSQAAPIVITDYGDDRPAEPVLRAVAGQWRDIGLAFGIAIEITALRTEPVAFSRALWEGARNELGQAAQDLAIALAAVRQAIEVGDREFV